MQARDRQPDRGAHPFHLVLAALVEHELQPIRPEPLCTCRRGPAVVEVDAVAQLPELLVARLALDLDLVDLLDAVPRVREAVRERPVVRQHERARRVGVEPTDRDDARVVVDEVDDGRPPLRVARRRHDARGLVQQHVGERLRRDRAAVDLDAVRLLDERVQLAGLAVHGHAAGLDQVVGASARGHAGTREVRVQAHSSSTLRSRRGRPSSKPSRVLSGTRLRTSCHFSVPET